MYRLIQLILQSLLIYHVLTINEIYIFIDFNSDYPTGGIHFATSVVFVCFTEVVLFKNLFEMLHNKIKVKLIQEEKHGSHFFSRKSKAFNLSMTTVH